MSDFLKKISSYNILNYLIPGFVFALYIQYFTVLNIFPENDIQSTVLCYFLGLVISRIGSLIIKPILEFFRVIQLVDYEAFVKASQKDAKIDILSEANNLYRSFVSLFLCIPIFELILHLYENEPFFRAYGKWIAIGILLLIFTFSYRKQTSFVVKRVKANKS